MNNIGLLDIAVKVCYAWDGKDEKKQTDELDIIIDLDY